VAGISLERDEAAAAEAQRGLTKGGKLIATTKVLGQSTFL